VLGVSRDNTRSTPIGGEDLVADWATFLAADAGAAVYENLRAAERTARPAADADLPQAFVTESSILPSELTLMKSLAPPAKKTAISLRDSLSIR
jgi:hypothetical protein